MKKSVKIDFIKNGVVAMTIDTSKVWKKVKFAQLVKVATNEGYQLKMSLR